MKICDSIIDQSGILLTRDAMKAGISKPALYRYIRENGFDQVAHGVYASPDAWEDKNYILSLRCPQGVISHDEALYKYGLIDREPMRQTITIYTGYGTSRLVADDIKVFTVKRELLNVGREMVKTPHGHMVPMYNRERTICDLVRSRNYFEIQDFQTALKSYAGSSGKDLNKLMEYAKLFHVDRLIREYMGVLL